MIEPGDKVLIKPLWNRTSRSHDQIEKVSYVIDTMRAVSQTGLLVKVRTKNGGETWLDSGWFENQSELI
jgi:hypothetical protein